MNKTQEKTLKRIFKALENMEVALTDFENDCQNKLKSKSRTYDERYDLEDYVRLTENAISSVISTKTFLEGIFSIAGI